MLTLANVGPNDYLIDLGSGDGRLVIAAVAKFNARGGMGIEIDPSLVKQATDLAEKAGVAGRVTFVAGDLFVADIEQATVVTLYLLRRAPVAAGPSRGSCGYSPRTSFNSVSCGCRGHTRLSVCRVDCASASARFGLPSSSAKY